MEIKLAYFCLFYRILISIWKFNLQQHSDTPQRKERFVHIDSGEVVSLLSARKAANDDLNDEQLEPWSAA